jgi:hypothetical protein
VYKRQGKYIPITTNEIEFALSKKEMCYLDPNSNLIHFLQPYSFNENSYDNNLKIVLKSKEGKNIIYTPCLLVEKETTKSMREMFNYWTQFDQTNPDDPVLANWKYDYSQDYIYNKNNQGGISGYYNPKDLDKRNYAISVSLMTDSHDDDMMGFSFRFQDENNYYSVQWSNGDSPSDTWIFGIPEITDHGLHLIKTKNGKKELLGSYLNPWERYKWEDLKIEISDNNIKVFHDETLVIDADDLNNPINNGAYGPLSKSQPSTYFKNLTYSERYVLEGETVYEDTKGKEEQLLENIYTDYINENDGSFKKIKCYTKEDFGFIEYFLKNKLIPHHIWNPFDEFGFLFDLERIPLETNESYKKRILDVNKNPGNSTKDGLYNHISRELGLNKNEISIEELNDKYYRENLIENSGLPTDKLFYIFEYIRNNIPLFWNELIWDEGYWDIVNKNGEEYDYLPFFADRQK